jgi:type II secretory pathway pseudopilin PulG
MLFTDCRRSNAGGFVLLEAVVALAIISLFAIGLLSMVGAQVRGTDRATVLLLERALAEDRLMAAGMLDNEDLKDLPDSLAAGTFAEPFDDFTWTLKVTPVEDEYDLFTTDVLISGRGYTLPMQKLMHQPRPIVQATQ